MNETAMPPTGQPSPTAVKAKNISNNLKDPRTRTTFIGLFLVIIVVMLVAGSIFLRKGSARPDASAVAAPPHMSATAGMSPSGDVPLATAQYDELLRQDNQLDAESARATGGSSIPRPRTGAQPGGFEAQSVDPLAPNYLPPPPPDAYQQTQPQPAVDQAQLEQQRQQEWEQRVQARAQAMKAQFSKLEAYWAVQPHQRFDVAAERQERSTAPNGVGATTAERTSEVGEGTVARNVPAQPDIVMGDVLYATLDFGINTDDPASVQFVQATVHEPGPFQGAKLIGSLQEGDQYAKTVGVHFTQMRVPGEPGPRSIDAWAVSPTAQRPSIASSVNNHYLSRGASMFIGSFLEGYSQALLQGGRQQTVVTSPTGAVGVQQDAFSSRQMTQIGVGNVGRTMAQTFAQGASRQRTVTVNAGADLGVWFLQDVARP